MSSRDDSNRITIVQQRVIDEEEAEDDILEAEKYDAMILKGAKIKLLEEGVFQVPSKQEEFLVFKKFVELQVY